jgi:phospholipid/cholesterol/gamma-HCH transport system substrate-binding protein
MRRLGWVSLLLAAVVGLSACGPTFTSLPLPGSGVSGNTITVKADFADALNLAQGAAVSINGVTSGRVQSVTASNFTAHVTMLVQTAANLRANAHVRLRYTTPLGELYVEVTNPSSGALMQNNGTLGLNQTETAPTVEDALASASLLINGGGLNQLQTIITEANKALGGHENNIRSLITQASNSMAQIYAAGGDIDRTLTALNAVSQSLAARRQIIHSALQDVGPAARALSANTANLTALLSSLDRFAGTANNVVGTNKTQLLNIVRQSQPVLQEIVNVRSQLAPSLNAIVSLAKSLNTAIPGDYLNLFVLLHIDTSLLTGTTSGAKAPTTKSGGGLLGGLLGSKTGTKGSGGLLSGVPVIGGLL